MRCYYQFLTAVILFLTSVIYGADARAAINNTAYGILAFSSDQSAMTNNIVTFDLESDIEPTFRRAVGYYETSTAGAYGDNAYYVAASQMIGSIEVAKELVRVDLEAGTYKTVGELTGYTNLINDMTYDRSAAKMYAISRIDDTRSALFTIDLKTAESSLVANLDRKFFTLAADYSGNLFAISFDGDLCSIDKTTGRVRVIGSTGQHPENFQSMEFDHETRTLWWIATTRRLNETGTVELSECFVAKVNTSTGEITRCNDFGDNQIAGLYIPAFAAPDNCPAAVSAPTAVAADRGEAKAVLSWTNPSETFGGEPLKTISKVEIKRDGVVVGNVSDAEPGKRSSFTDILDGENSGSHTWLITAYNTNGAGASAAVSTFVGRDIPAPATGITVERLTPNSARIAWEPASAGVNGGWCDPESFTYTVVRYPDEKVIASNISETECTDSGAEVSGTYHYAVTTTSSCGTSEAAISPTVALGPKLGTPYTCEFSTDDFGQWTPYDGNDDGNVWTQMYINWARADAAFISAASYALDDWLISNLFELEPESTYKVKLNTMSMGVHPLSFYLLSESDTSAPLQELGSLEIERSSNFADNEFTFTTGANIGDCNIAIRDIAPQGSSLLYLNSISIEKLVARNLAASAVTGNVNPIEGNTYRYAVTIDNKGSETVDSYTVELIDSDGSILASAAVSEPIASGESANVSVDCHFPYGATVSAIYGRVKADNDMIEADNTSPALAITMLPLGSSEEVNIGTRESTSSNHPLNFYDKFGASQNIYSADEIGIPRGRISDIRISYSCYSDLTNAEVKIYLSNTDRMSNADGWIPLDEYTLVFNDHIDISRSETELNFELANAFDYEGGNLAMLVVTSLAGANRSYLSMSQPYYTSPLVGNSAIGYGNDYNEFDPSKTFTSRRGNSCVTFMMRSGGAAVTGFVTDADSNPVEGAEVAIPEIRASTKSAADGSFRFDFVPNGEFSIQAKMFGYKDSEASKITISDNDATTTIRIEKLPVYTVSGRVLSPDGNTVEGAAITLTGYSDLSTTSKADGTFSFSDVVISEETTVTVSKDRYVDFSETFNLNADKNMGDITLGYAHFSPAGITVATSDNAASLTWNSPSAETDFIYDSGKADTQIGFSESIGTIVIGTAFRTPMTLNRVSWFTTSEGGPHNSVNVYIYDLDDEGNPTGTMLYSERAVRNTDGQWTELTLENPVDAPRGCFVALNYPGFHGIGVDDDHKAFPFRENTYAFSTDYTSGDFAYFDNETLSGNLMIRAAGNAWSAEGMKPAASDAPEICTYNVWRASGYGSDDWTSLNSSPLTTTSFSDATWENAPAGVYRYAVSSHYPDGSESARTISNYIVRDMIGSLTLHLSTNSTSGSAAGASVKIEGTDPADTRSASADESGLATFPEIWRDKYSLTVSLPGYTPVSKTIDLTATKDAVDNIELEEIIATPVNTSISGNFESGFLFTWNESGEIFDGFEDHEPFTVASPGNVGWIYRDADASRTFAEADFDFPGRTQPCSFMVFNPSMTSPSMADQRSASIPYEGDAELASFAGYNGSDDWFISPRLTYHNDFTLKFMARGYSRTYGEVIRVGYSTTDTSPMSFTWLADRVDIPMQVWTEFEYTVPAAASYVAINCISPDGFTLFIDNVEISSGNGFEMNTAVSGPEVIYAVSLDGEELARTTDCSYMLSNVAKGAHTAEVKAVYASGESAPATVRFGETGLNGLNGSEISVWPNPAPGYTIVRGDFSRATIYDLSGRSLKTFDGTEKRLDLSGFAHGIYLLVIETEDNLTTTIKLAVR